MTNDEVYLEKEPMGEKAQQMTDILRGMNIKERTEVVLDMLAHDQDVMDSVRARMNWEIRNAVIQGMKEHREHPDPRDVDKIFGGILSDEVDETMPAVFGELYEKYTEELEY